MGCNWHCTAYTQKDGLLRLWVVERLHIYEGSGVTKFSLISKKDSLDKVVSGLLHVVKMTKPLEIKDIIQDHFTEDVSYKVAQLCQPC